jgi:pimeloyl-ACP methyl ester carboxylesterase
MPNELTYNEIAYYKEGIGDAVILLHGYPMDKNCWMDLMVVLSSAYKVIAIDIPRLGNSKNVHLDSITTIADEIHKLLVHEGIAQAVFVGHSMGGYIALSICDRFKEMAMGLSLVHSTMKSDTEEKKCMRLKVIDLVSNGGAKVFLKELFPSLFAPSNKTEFKLEWEGLLSRYQSVPSVSLISLYKAIMERQDYAEGAWNQLPMQWIIGKQDQLLDAKDLINQALQSNISFVSLYPDCGHMSMIENARQFEKDIVEFTNFCYAKTNQK